MTNREKAIKKLRKIFPNAKIQSDICILSDKHFKTFLDKTKWQLVDDVVTNLDNNTLYVMWISEIDDSYDFIVQQNFNGPTSVEQHVYFRYWDRTEKYITDRFIEIKRS